MGVPALPHQANTGYFQMWVKGEFEYSCELDLRHLSWLPQPVSPQSNTAGWWLMPQTLHRRRNAPALWEQEVFLQSVPYLASVPDRPSQCGEPGFLTVRKTGLKTNWSFHSWPFPSFPSTWTQLRTRSLMFCCNKDGIIEDGPLWGEVSFPRNCLCSVHDDKPGNSIAVSLQGSPTRHLNCPSCGWPGTLLLVHNFI